MSDHHERIRQRAYQIWLDEGRPAGRDSAHWEMARQLVAIEDNQKSTLVPLEESLKEPVEPAEVAENMGEFPTMTDQGEQTYPPNRSAARSRKKVE